MQCSAPLAFLACGAMPLLEPCENRLALCTHTSNTVLHVALSWAVCCAVSKSPPRFKTTQMAAAPALMGPVSGVIVRRASCPRCHAAARMLRGLRCALRLQVSSAGLHVALSLVVCCNVSKSSPCFKTVQRAAVPALMRPENGARDGRGQGFRLTLVLEPICAHARARVRVHTCA